MLFQFEVMFLITVISCIIISNVEFRKVKPVEYKLFQVADLVCTLELLSAKAETDLFSNSEMEFFHSVKEFKKNYYKWISRKHI